MDRSEFAARIDHTVLGPTTTPADVRATVAEAAEYGMNACVPPCYVDVATGAGPEVDVVTVVGFPHGTHESAVKREEAVAAWQAGAAELDVVAAVGRLLAGEDGAVRRDIEEVVAAVPVPVKVIVEATLLGEDQLRRACEAVRAAGADYVKTSTGFAGGGAELDDVRVMAEYLPVKASGGIGSYDAAAAMLEAGAERIGASAGVDLVEGFGAEGGGDA
jgi:deoxyribose-phosphate aldolase